jgi:hypothetical protein
MKCVPSLIEVTNPNVEIQSSESSFAKIKFMKLLLIKATAKAIEIPTKTTKSFKM